MVLDSCEAKINYLAKMQLMSQRSGWNKAFILRGINSVIHICALFKMRSLRLLVPTYLYVIFFPCFCKTDLLLKMLTFGVYAGNLRIPLDVI